MAALRFTEADRDERGRIRTDFAALLDDTMAAVGAAPAASDQPAAAVRPQLGRHTYIQLIGALAIVVVMSALAIVALWPRAGAPARDVPTLPARATAPAQQPTAPAAVATLDAYAAPDGAKLGPIPADTVYTYRDSRYPGWAGADWAGGVVWVRAEPPAGARDLAPPTPAPTVERVYVPVEPPCDPQINPRYRVQEDVYDGARPIGQVVGVSCNSQEEAQQHADAAAAEMKKGKKP